MPASGRVYLPERVYGSSRQALSSLLGVPHGALFTQLRSALFLIVFLESKVVKSMISTPIYSRPTRAPRPNVHIWPRLNLQKASKSALFQWRGGKSRMLCKAASGRYSPWNFKGCACLRATTLRPGFSKISSPLLS